MRTGIAIFFFDKVSFLRHPSAYTLCPQPYIAVKIYHKLCPQPHITVKIYYKLCPQPYIAVKIYYKLCPQPNIAVRIYYDPTTIEYVFLSPIKLEHNANHLSTRPAFSYIVFNIYF